MMGGHASALNYHDLRDMARRKLPKGLFEFIDRGVEDEVALHGNQQSFRRIRLSPHTLRGVATANPAAMSAGRSAAMPVAIAPTGVCGLAAFEGEVAMARAAAIAGIPFTLSNASVTAMETIARQAPDADLWFQLYVSGQDELVASLVRRADDAAYRVLVVTTDGAGGSNREYNQRNRFTIPMKITPRVMWDVMQRPGWLACVLLRQLLVQGVPTFANYPPPYRIDLFGRPTASARVLATLGQPVVTRDLLCRLRDKWQGRLLVKGILTPEDAEIAVDCGADGVVVSNHGGRNLDSAVAPIDALPAIVAAMGSRTELLLDSGTTRGSDIAKALALGAHGVMVGRMPVWGMTCGGQAAALHSLDILRQALVRTMIQLGCATIGDIDAGTLWQDTGIASPRRDTPLPPEGSR